MTTAPLDVEKCRALITLTDAGKRSFTDDLAQQLLTALILLAEAREVLTKLLAGRRFGESGHVYRLEVNVEDDARAENLLANIPNLSELKL